MDWIRLWILNELVVCPARASRLVFHPDVQWEAYWTFPGRPALQADTSARRASIIRSAIAGEIVLYNEFTDGDLRGFQELKRQHYHELERMGDRSLRHVFAAITKIGHEVWESDFVPDWSRIWSNGPETLDDDGRLASVEIMCASEAMMNELRDYLPAYRGLDKRLDLHTVECSTVFGVQVTFWKILPIAMRVKWNVPPDPRELGMTPSELHATVRERVIQQAVAERVLNRLSRKWGCRTISECRPRDGDPIPLDWPCQ